jgi:hypothetical protein
MIDLTGSASAATAAEPLTPQRFRLFHEAIELIIAGVEGEKEKTASGVSVSP